MKKITVGEPPGQLGVWLSALAACTLLSFPWRQERGNFIEQRKVSTKPRSRAPNNLWLLWSETDENSLLMQRPSPLQQWRGHWFRGQRKKTIFPFCTWKWPGVPSI